MYLTNFIFLWLFGSRAHFISLSALDCNILIIVTAKIGGPGLQDNRTFFTQTPTYW